jgi:hypothetical protein
MLGAPARISARAPAAVGGKVASATEAGDGDMASLGVTQARELLDEAMQGEVLSQL